MFFFNLPKSDCPGAQGSPKYHQWAALMSAHDERSPWASWVLTMSGAHRWALMVSGAQERSGAHERSWKFFSAHEICDFFQTAHERSPWALIGERSWAAVSAHDRSWLLMAALMSKSGGNRGGINFSPKKWLVRTYMETSQNNPMYMFNQC